MHKKKKFEDNLKDIRADLKYVNETQKRINGFEQGRSAHAFRYDYPIYDKKNHYIGVVEISFASEYLQNNFTNIGKLHTHFLVNKDVFEAKTWARNDLILKYNQSAEHKDFMITMTEQHTHKKCIIERNITLKESQQDLLSAFKEGKKFSIFLNKKEIEIVSFLPIYNTSGKQLSAWIVSYEKDKFIELTLKNTIYVRIVLFLILLILFYFIYRTLMQRYMLEEMVEVKTNDLKELNENLEQKIIIEVEKSKQIESKLFQSEKMASMGEMIGNIAHQWRQPLSAIATGATGMLMKKEYGLLTDEDFAKTCNSIDKHAQYLSQTIDDFRNYIKGDRSKTTFTLKSDIDSFIHLIEGSLKQESINIIVNIDDSISIDGYPNELVQCFINIYNNAKDAFIENKIENKYLIISSKQQKDAVEIIIQDNACGIDEDIISKIFEPYFTTKHKMQGTGLGLHMTYTLIVEGMKGNIEVSNKTFDYNDNRYMGAEFIITLPN